MVKIETDLATSATAVFVFPDGERSFLHSLGANSKFGIDDIDLNYLKNFSIVHIGGIFLLPGFEGSMKEMDSRILSFDTAWDSTGRWLSVIEEAMEFVDYFFTSFEEAKMLSGQNHYQDMAKFFIDKGVKNICIKMGTKGSFIAHAREKEFFPALKVPTVDSTGAGDAYVAGFITAVLQKWPFLKCGLFANAVGAMSVTAIGATNAVKNWESFVYFAKEHNVQIFE